ncbi:MAG TPA: formimidoylglutamase [Balneolales bacterium]|nr:formimidoylglutamase [Balneolales bacterium]
MSDTNLFNEPDIELPRKQEDDPRIGHLIKFGEEQITEDTRIVLIGFPSDEGVKRNWGRPGAAKAPDYIRTALYKLTPPPDQYLSFLYLLDNTVDLGNLNISGDVEEDQDLLGKIIAEYLEKDIIPIILGGGHETAFGHFSGYIHSRKKCHILNWDAHADVRELKEQKAHSGSPFRQAILHPSDICQTYTVAGLLPHSVANKHLDFISRNNGCFFMKNELNKQKIDQIYSRYTMPVMVTFDMDALDQSYAPGVSAPAVNGMSPDLFLYAARTAGASPHVHSFDFVEFNPDFDRDNQTAKITALTIWYCLAGLAERLT